MKNSLVFCENLRMTKKGNYVIIGNRNNGEWMKLAEECYIIIKNSVDRHDSKSELLNRLYDKEDICYMDDLISRLEMLDILYEDNKYSSNIRHWKNITFSITENCNLTCKHCCLSAGECYSETMTTEEIYKIIDKILVFDSDCLVITGGEPLLRNDFLEIAQYLKLNYHGVLSLMTNGTLISEDNAKVIAETFKQISISIDGYDDESCAKIRGIGVFNRIVNGIKLLQKYGSTNISLSMIVNTYTCEHIEEFKQLNETLRTTSVMRKFAPIGRGFINREELMNLDNLISYGPVIEHMISKYKSVCMDSSTSSGKYITVCGALKNQFFISGNKYIYPCSALHLEEFKIEHIDSIKDLKKYMDNEMYKETSGYKKYISILPENYDHCKDCSINIFCSGCPLYVYMYNKSGILDYFCQQQKAKEEYIIWS